MTDLRDWKDPMNDLELLVRAAGNYVQASSDLRPRVLETARACRGERRLQRCLYRVTISILLVMATSIWIDRSQGAAGSRDEAMLEQDGVLHGSIWPQIETAPGDASWDTVEAFTEVRRRQAQVLRSSL
jgi:hypothetical protein